MSMEPGKKGHPVLLGCAIVFAIVLVLVATGGPVGYSFFKSKMAQQRGNIADRFEQEYERAKADGKLSQEQQEVFGELGEFVKKPELTFVAIASIASFFDASLAAREDEQPKCLAAGRELLELLKKNPGVGIAELGEYMHKYQDVLNEMKHSGGK